jgi:hypothetical protein
MSERITKGRRVYIFTRPDGTTVAEKPFCCKRIFKETEKIRKFNRSFRPQEYDIINRSKWEKLTIKEKDESAILEEAKSTLDDIEEILKDDF